MSITLYFVGDDHKSALNSMAFDSIDSAEDYRQDNGFTYVYGVIFNLVPDSAAVLIKNGQEV